MAIIFDLDGTLINSLNLHATSIKKGIDSVIGEGKISYRFVQKNIRYPTSFLFKLIKDDLGINLSNEQKRLILENKRRYMSEMGFKGVRPYSGVSDTFNLLRREKIKFCIATSMPKRELPLLRSSDKLRIIFSVPIFCPDVMEHEKPNPFVLDMAIEKLHLSRATSFYVGDSITDMEAAKNAGINFIGVFNSKLSDSELFFRDMVGLNNFIRKNLAKFK
ncbi:MAG: HAD family hydrolase [Candidatus Acidifodinimicrobium sp.]